MNYDAVDESPPNWECCADAEKSRIPLAEESARFAWLPVAPSLSLRSSRLEAGRATPRRYLPVKNPTAIGE